MNSLDAVFIVLQNAKEPLHYQEITKRILQQNLWITEGKTPDATINARVAVDIKRKGPVSRFQRTEPGYFALREWGLDEYQLVRTEPVEDTKKLSFTDAAEYVLDNLADKNPMHYRDIMEQILLLDLITTEGQTPEATLYSMILSEIKRQSSRNDSPRFVKFGDGMVGLRKWMGEGLAFQIDKHNRQIKKKLLGHLSSLTPSEFELLVGTLLTEMGFEETNVTKLSGDGGIDVRGTLVVGGVIRTQMAVQAKKWKHNISSPIIQQVRGSLGAHEQGMIITTSGFSKGAIGEAERADATPVALMDGEQLVDLLLQYQILSKRIAYELYYLDIDDE
ncbi:MAG TPA: restriction endonuclease [Chloroflexi bacterium]|nr:restriction endonuclease [Chloroflexota bacterium]